MTKTESRLYSDCIPAGCHIVLKPLDCCNAYVRCYENNQGYAVGYELVSYNTPVMYIKACTCEVYALQACTCSNTTRHHVRRFLTTYMPDNPRAYNVGYGCIKQLLDLNPCSKGIKYDSITWDVVPINKLPYVPLDVQLDARKPYNNGFQDIYPSRPFDSEARESRKQVCHA